MQRHPALSRHPALYSYAQKFLIFPTASPHPSVREILTLKIFQPKDDEGVAASSPPAGAAYIVDEAVTTDEDKKKAAAEAAAVAAKKRDQVRRDDAYAPDDSCSAFVCNLHSCVCPPPS